MYYNKYYVIVLKRDDQFDGFYQDGYDEDGHFATMSNQLHDAAFFDRESDATLAAKEAQTFFNKDKEEHEQVVCRVFLLH